MSSEEARKSQRQSPTWAKSLADLRSLSYEELVRQHDELAVGATASTGSTGTVVNIDYYLSELARRDADRQTRTMVRLTWVILFLTIVNVIAVIVQVAG